MRARGSAGSPSRKLVPLQTLLVIANDASASWRLQTGRHEWNLESLKFLKNIIIRILLDFSIFLTDKADNDEKVVYFIWDQ